MEQEKKLRNVEGCKKIFLFMPYKSFFPPRPVEREEKKHEKQRWDDFSLPFYARASGNKKKSLPVKSQQEQDQLKSEIILFKKSERMRKLVMLNNSPIDSFPPAVFHHFVDRI